MSSARFTPQTEQRPSTASSQSKQKRQSSASRRARQLLNFNQNTINNLINDNASLKSKSLDIKVSSPRKLFPTESVLVKKPFKHFNTANAGKPMSAATKSTITKPIIPQVSKSEPTTANAPKTPNPSSDLILKTAQVVNNFVDFFDRNQNQVSILSSRISTRRPLQYSNYSGLKPLNYVVHAGPNIQNCIGIIKEPKVNNTGQLREIYEYKLRLLEKKRAMEKPTFEFNDIGQHNLIVDDNNYYDNNF